MWMIDLRDTAITLAVKGARGIELTEGICAENKSIDGGHLVGNCNFIDLRRLVNRASMDKIMHQP